MSKSDITSLRQAAKLAGVTPEAVRKWCDAGLMGQKDGLHWRIKRADLNRVIRARAVLGR